MTGNRAGEDLGALIRRRFGSAYRFCRATGLPRGTVYQVLSGKYAGNLERQRARILAVAEGAEGVTQTAVFSAVLSRVACGMCPWRGRCPERRATRCAAVVAAQASALERALSGGNRA